MSKHMTSQIAESLGHTVQTSIPPWRRPALKATLVSKPRLPERALPYVEDVLRSGWWGYGPVAQHLQATIEQLYEGRQNALATSSEIGAPAMQTSSSRPRASARSRSTRDVSAASSVAVAASPPRLSR